ncbi:MAG: acylphosphatase [Firmicutes bacterium]|nr:acylphosphatase [Bacillota bacterium]
MAQLIRKAFCFYGQVQGVGFRYTARHLADRYGLTGWVRNEYDGSVSMELQGTPLDISSMLHQLEDGHFIRIDHIESKNVPVVDGERRFRVDPY